MSDDFVTVATFSDAMEAEIARNRLEAEGIRAVLMDRETVAMAWHVAQAIGGVKLLVAEADEERAVEILDNRRFVPDEEDVPEDAIVAAADRHKLAPRHDEHQAIVAAENLDKVASLEPDDDTPTERELDAERAFKSQVFAFLFFPLQLMALIFIISVASSHQRLEGRPRRQFHIALALHALGWLVFLLFGLPFCLAPRTLGV
jgi:hypothetical protein